MTLQASRAINLHQGHNIWAEPFSGYPMSASSSSQLSQTTQLPSHPRKIAVPHQRRPALPKHHAQDNVPPQVFPFAHAPTQVYGPIAGEDVLLRRKTPAGPVDQSYKGSPTEVDAPARVAKQVLSNNNGGLGPTGTTHYDQSWQNVNGIVPSHSYPSSFDPRLKLNHRTAVAASPQFTGVVSNPTTPNGYILPEGSWNAQNGANFGSQHGMLPMAVQLGSIARQGPFVQGISSYGPLLPAGTIPYNNAQIMQTGMAEPVYQRQLPLAQPANDMLMTGQHRPMQHLLTNNQPPQIKVAFPAAGYIPTQSPVANTPVGNGLSLTNLTVTPHQRRNLPSFPPLPPGTEQVLQFGHLVYHDLVQHILVLRQAQNDQPPARLGSKRLPLVCKLNIKSLPDADYNQHRIDSALTSLSQLAYSDLPIAIEAMLLCGCISYVIGENNLALAWFATILQYDPCHVEAMSNIAATYLAVQDRKSAELAWGSAVRMRPDYFEAAEHLLGMLCAEKRHKEAIKIIEFIQVALWTPNELRRRGGPNTYAEKKEGERNNIHGPNEPRGPVGYASEPLTEHLWPLSRVNYGNASQDSYRVRDADIGKIIALVHMKANLLYGLGDTLKAAQSFEEAVLLAVGMSDSSLGFLVQLLYDGLSNAYPSQSASSDSAEKAVLLLSPEQAVNTAQICFALHQDLPGVRHLADQRVKQTVLSIASNSLLSLSKIFQDSMSARGCKAVRDKQYSVADIVVLYYLSLSLQASPSTANNVGILLATVQQTQRDLRDPLVCNDEDIMALGVDPCTGNAFAFMYYKYGLELDSHHSHLYTNLGSLFKDLGQLPRAIQMYLKAVECDKTFDIALANLANAIKDQGKTAEAITYYKLAVDANPNFAEAICGLSNALNSICEWTGRGGVFPNHGSFDRWHVNEKRELVDSYKEKKGFGWMMKVVDLINSQLPDGEVWGRGVFTSSVKRAMRYSFNIAAGNYDDPMAIMSLAVTAHQQWHDQPFEGIRLVRLIERLTRIISWQWYRDKYILKRKKKSEFYRRPQLPSTLAAPTVPTVLPFHTFTMPMTAKQVRLISQRNGLRVSVQGLRSPWVPKHVHEPPSPPDPYLKVAYISSDFNNHPLAHLMQSVFGLHDPKRVKVYCYALTRSDKSAFRKKIERESPDFYDVTDWSNARIVAQIVKDGIHIAVNLNGYTRGARNEIFTSRPAPIQMAFMGFAGSMGAEWSDYLLADDIAVPPSATRPHRSNVTVNDLLVDENDVGSNEDWVFSENIIYTRSSFFCCDHKQGGRERREDAITWDEEVVNRWRMRKELFPNIPDNAVILGNFNQLYKIDPTTFRSWLRILSKVPNAYLWLLRFPALGEEQLLATARDWIGESVASRIIFTNVAPKAKHIQRSCIADLFLDTPECNAHTTAADCLWSGTPILTLPRHNYKMCSRMAASILRGALDWPDDTKHRAQGISIWRYLVASSDDDYETKAVELARELKYEVVDGIVHQNGFLIYAREMLWKGRWTARLFDTERWVRELEEAYEEAWRRWVAGEGGDIWMKCLNRSWLDL